MNTEGLGILRSIVGNELPLMLTWRNSPRVRANMFTQHEISSEEHASWWEQQSQARDRKHLMFEHNGMPSGIVSFHDIREGDNTCAWAFYASPTAPRGTGSKMELLALEYAFCEMRLRKLNCEVLALNDTVLKLHAKFGFQIEGVLRQERRVGEQYVDVYRLGIFASEWAARREEIMTMLVKHKR